MRNFSLKLTVFRTRLCVYSDIELFKNVSAAMLLNNINKYVLSTDKCKCEISI